MTVMYLDELFPEHQSLDRFNQRFTDEGEAEIYNSRRVWSNGVLEIYFTDRFEDGGVCLYGITFLCVYHLFVVKLELPCLVHVECK